MNIRSIKRSLIFVSFNHNRELVFVCPCERSCHKIIVNGKRGTGPCWRSLQAYALLVRLFVMDNEIDVDFTVKLSEKRCMKLFCAYRL